MEVDETCCKVYSEIFRSPLANNIRQTQRWLYSPSQDEIWRCSIDKLPDEAFEGGELWLLSPPCQPFARTGNQRDTGDRRCAALLRLIEALPRLSSPPRALLLENVPGFVGSRAHRRLRRTLKLCERARGISFEVEEFVLNPTDFGFPNTRKRFYCLATVSGPSAVAPVVPLPGRGAPSLAVRPVREFCNVPAVAAAGGALTVERKLLEKAHAASWQIDLATAGSTATKTFMSSYGKPAYSDEGLSKAGPLLLTQVGGHAAAEEERPRFALPSHKDWGRIRYFAPAEMLALQGYPKGWALPAGVSIRKQMKLIGNSINVVVVQRLLERLLAKL